MKKNKKELNRENDIEYTADFFNQQFGPLSPTDVSEVFSEATATEHGEWASPHQQIDEDYDGQLAVDVFQTDNAIIVQAAVAGVRNEDLDISLNGDMITIKGHRKPQYGHLSAEDYFIEECYWGNFSRSIILPLDVVHDEIAATLENGILTITLPKAKRSHNTRISVRQLD